MGVPPADGASHSAEVKRGEFYTFQLGAFALASLRVLPTAHLPLSTPAVGWQEDVFIGELKFDDKEGNTLGCLRFAFSQLGLEEKEL